MNKISSNIIRYSLLIALVGLGIAAYSQPPTQTKWEAYWIAHPEDKGQDFGVYLFRKSIDFEQIPQNLNVYVSADNRYKLFVNGQLVAKGPARDDLAHWRYETVDIAPYLIHGRNTVAAQVWNMGEYRPMAQHTLRTGFILQSDKAELNSNETWKVMRDYSIIPLPVDNTKLQTYIVVGPGEITDGNKFPWGWEVGKDNNSSWVDAKPIDRGTPKGVGTDQTWQLVPREIPFMEEKIVRFKECRRIEGAVKDKNWLNKSDLIIPAKSKATLLLDQGVLNVGYPVMKISGGKNAEITLTYAESLTDKEGNKGNRNEILNKEIKGNQDIIISDGEKGREYTTLWLRTFRYVALDIVTGDEPLIVEDLYSFFSAYPFEQKAVFKSDQTWINDVLEVGWRTARLCAGETYFDCPYYEQMQYVGDTRIQALISVYQTGDARLFKKSIDLFDHSRFDEGLTRSRYPSYAPQVIPTYSLFWVNMLHDYWMHVPDEEYIKSKLFGIKSVLDWFDKQVDEKTGLIGNTPYWNFVDWTPEWRWDNEIGQGGVPDLEGGSSIVSLQYAYSLDAAADLHEYFGEGHEAEKYRSISQRIKNQVMISCFDEEKGLIADTPKKKSFSQHANLLAILTDAYPNEKHRDILEKLLSEKDLIQATYYFKFYLFRVLQKTGRGAIYLEQLSAWKEMLDLGLSTFAEKPDPTRSDCHAWSASPNYDIFSITAGITPIKPGFGEVRIQPELANLKEIEISVPHPAGTIYMHLKKNKSGMKGRIELPVGIIGEFIYGDKIQKLNSGENTIH